MFETYQYIQTGTKCNEPVYMIGKAKACCAMINNTPPRPPICQLIVQASDTEQPKYACTHLRHRVCRPLSTTWPSRDGRLKQERGKHDPHRAPARTIHHLVLADIRHLAACQQKRRGKRNSGMYRGAP